MEDYSRVPGTVLTVSERLLRKPLKRFLERLLFDTGLKPGVNEKGPFEARPIWKALHKVTDTAPKARDIKARGKREAQRNASPLVMPEIIA